MKRINTIFLLVILSSLISCNKAKLKTVCGVDDPIKELPWLTKIVEDSEASKIKIHISKAVFKKTKSYKKLEGFVINRGSIFDYYNCVGDIICGGGGFIGTVCDKYDVLSEEKIY